LDTVSIRQTGGLSPLPVKQTDDCAAALGFDRQRAYKKNQAYQPELCHPAHFASQKYSNHSSRPKGLQGSGLSKKPPKIIFQPAKLLYLCLSKK
jgi:hypothetical protein